MPATIIYRKQYMDKLLSFKDTEFIKVITGIRRSGKSTLLKLMKEELMKNGIKKTQIIEMNFESYQFMNFSVDDFYSYVDNHRCNEKMYLFFDELQKVPEWQKAVNAFRVDFDCDIYITGSNAFLLSSELSTYLSGRYIEIKVYPLSLKEFLQFHNLHAQKKETNIGRKWIVTDNEGIPYTMDEIFAQYIRFGGMPPICEVGFDIEKVSTVLDGIYSAVVIRDILEKGKLDNQRSVTDSLLLRKIIMFLADIIGNNTSASSISNTLLNEGLVSAKEKPAVQTVQTYIEALTNANIFYEIKRFDIKGKQYLRTLGKYYIVDTGLRNYLLGFRDGDRGNLLENVIYFSLLRQGYSVSIGKIDNQEIDFIATKTNEKKYIQVSESMVNPDTRNRELKPLCMVQDNYEKIIITGDKDMFEEENGIKIIQAIDFLMDE